MYLYSRVKSLSKGNNSKRDVSSSSTNVKDSNAQALGSGSTVTSNFEDSTAEGLNGSGRFGWTRESERETSPSPGYSDYYRAQKGGPVDMSVDDYDDSEDVFEQEKPFRADNKNKKTDTYQVPAPGNMMMKNDTRTKLKDFDDYGANSSNSDDDLNALLKVGKQFWSYHIGLFNPSDFW